MPEQVVQHRQDMNRVTDLSNPVQQRTSRRKHRNQLCSNPSTQHSWMPIPRQPSHIRQQDRVNRPDPLILPSDLFTSDFRSGELAGIARTDLIIQPYIDNKRRSIRVSSKVIRHMASAIVPVEPKGLRRYSHHIRGGVEKHQLIALQPRLVSHMLTRGREPPQAREVPLTTKTRELPYWVAIQFELKCGATIQRNLVALTTRDVLQVNVTSNLRRNRRRRRPHPSNLEAV
ncbi:Uncharacterised protein [Mycobacteroides abscessus subsp. abscessus]|nr:Uncharacterised protein [Mycobacteroides abscessus subsp. abscessus]